MLLAAPVQLACVPGPLRSSIDQMLRSMLFQRPGGDRSFIPEDYSRLHTEMAESMMGEEEACRDLKQEEMI